MPDDTSYHGGTNGTFTLTRRGTMQYIECRALDECGSITHGFCTRWGGTSEERLTDFNFGVQVGDSEEHLEHNRERLRTAFDLPRDNPATVSQVHGDRLLIIDETTQRLDSTAYLPYDGILTAVQGIAIGIKTADCVPLLIADRMKRIIGVVHAGWRGTASGIAPNAIERMIHVFASDPNDIIVAIGPSIGPCCYEVDASVFHAFDNTPAQQRAFTPGRRAGKWMCNLPAANRLQLLHTGIPPENIFSADICTSCRHDIFYSHRAEEGNTGRQISFLMLHEESELMKSKKLLDTPPDFI